MIDKKPTKEEQIEALIHRRAYYLVMECAPAEELSAEAYTQVFTVKRNEILDYLVRHYQISDLVSMKPMDRDGFYAIPVKDGFHVYEQERKLKAMEKIVSDELGVWNEFVDYLLGHSGTGLNFD